MNSYWKESTNETNYGKLNNKIETQTCIIGAGITGIATAYELAKQGQNVVILEKEKVAMGVTANTTGKITSQHGLIYKYLIDNFGMEDAREYLEANEEAIKTIQKNIENNKIECDLEVQDAYIYTNEDSEVIKIKEEVDALKKLGFDAEYCTQTELPFNVLSAIKFKNQAQFNVRKYLLGLLKALDEMNVEIYENSKVVDVKKDGEKYDVITEEGVVKSKNVVICTHYPIINFPGFHFLKMYQERSYIVAVETKQKLFNRNVYIKSNARGIF